MHPNLSTLRQQRGAILVTSLLLLLVLTVLGITTLRMTTMQERMAGNTRDLGLAFQGAEAGLTEGEQWLRGRVVQPVATGTLPCEVCQQFGSGNVPVVPVNIEHQDATWWEDNGVEVAGEIDDLDAQPRYVIEEAGFVRDSLLFDETAGRDFYRVTSQSTGASGLANSVLQSTYARRF
jgi:type IV pilus assembly protein PilX